MVTTGKESLSYSTVKKWATEFKRERAAFEDDGRSGRPKHVIDNETFKVVHTLVMCDRKRYLRSIASEVGTTFGAVQSFLTDIFGISKVSARRLPRMLIDDQKRIRYF